MVLVLPAVPAAMQGMAGGIASATAGSDTLAAWVKWHYRARLVGNVPRRVQ